MLRPLESRYLFLLIQTKPQFPKGWRLQVHGNKYKNFRRYCYVKPYIDLSVVGVSFIINLNWHTTKNGFLVRPRFFLKIIWKKLYKSLVKKYNTFNITFLAGEFSNISCIKIIYFIVKLSSEFTNKTGRVNSGLSKITEAIQGTRLFIHIDSPIGI